MFIEEKNLGPRVRADDEEVTQGDFELADEIATFVADRAFEFDDYECRAWAITDFDVWARLAGRTPRLVLTGTPLDEDEDEEVRPSIPDSEEPSQSN